METQEIANILNGIFKFIGIAGVVIIITGIGLVITFLVTQEKRHRNFLKNLTEGQPLKFYIGEEKHYGWASKVGKIYIEVTYFNPETNCNNSIKLQRDAIYPKFGYNYKKLKP